MGNKYRKKIEERLYFIHKQGNNVSLISNYDSFYSEVQFNEIIGFLTCRSKLKTTDLTFPIKELTKIVEDYHGDQKIFSEFEKQDIYFSYFLNDKFNDMHIMSLEKKNESHTKLSSIDGIVLIPSDSEDKDVILDELKDRKELSNKFKHEYLPFGNYFKDKNYY